MAVNPLQVRRVQTSQPQGLARVVPQAVGLKNPFLSVASTSLGYDCVTGRLPSSVSGGSVTTGTQGLGRKFVGNTLDRQSYTVAAAATAQTQFTAQSVFVWRSGAANNYPQLCGTSSVNSGFRLGSGNALGADIGLTKGGVVALPTLALASDTPYAMVVSHDQVSGVYYILLRNLLTNAITSVSGTDTSVSAAGDGNAEVGNARTDFAGAWNGDIFTCTMAFEFLPRAQGEIWVRNPWQLFQAAKQPIFIAASSVSTTLKQLSLKPLQTSQPQQVAQVDWKNPITRGLAIAITGNNPTVNLATNAAVVSSTGVAQLVGDKGVGLTFPSTAGTGVKVNSSTTLRGSLGNGSGLTILILANPQPSATRIMPFSIGGTSPEIYIAFNADAGLGASSGKFASCLWNHSGSEGLAGAVDGKTHLFGVIHPEGASSYTPQLYLDGAGPFPEVSTTFYPPTSAADTVAGYQGGGFSATGYSQFLTLAFNRVLSDDEMRSMAANPWQLFAAPPRRLWVAASGGGGTVSGAGTAAGSSTASGVGASVATSAGTASGSSVTSGVGASVATAMGASAGGSTASGVGASVAAGAGTAAGGSTASGSGTSVAAGAGTASGGSTALGVGTSIVAGAGTSAGTSTALGVSTSVAAATGTASGTSVASGVGSSVAAGSGTGTAAGSSTASGVGASVAAGTGSAAGTSTALGVGASTIAAAGTAAGGSTASGVGASVTAVTIAGTGTAAGGSTAIAISYVPGGTRSGVARNLLAYYQQSFEDARKAREARWLETLRERQAERDKLYDQSHKSGGSAKKTTTKKVVGERDPELKYKTVPQGIYSPAKQLSVTDMIDRIVLGYPVPTFEAAPRRRAPRKKLADEEAIFALLYED